MRKLGSGKGRDRALMVEFWIAALVVGGSFLAGLWQMLCGLF